jgi:NADP-reducing hydrogenase subunit HndB
MMPKLSSLEELQQLREKLQKDIQTRTESSITITVGLGTCGIAAGAREVMQALLDQLAATDIDAHVTTVGCIGLCSEEPLVGVKCGDEPNVLYGHVTPARVPRIVEEHLKNGHVVNDWVVAVSD